MPLASNKLVAYEEIADEMTDEEYSAFLRVLEKKGYINHAITESDGTPIDVNDYISAGINMLAQLNSEE